MSGVSEANSYAKQRGSKFSVRSGLSAVNKVSKFFITINTNQAFRERSALEVAKRELIQRVEEIFDSFERFLSLYRVDGSNFRRLSVSADQVSRHMVSGDIEHHIEIGKINHRLHTHALVTIEHSPDVAFRIDLRKLRAALPPNTHLHAMYVRDQSFSMLKYIRKSQV